jgi:dienelactone hydrolase
MSRGSVLAVLALSAGATLACSPTTVPSERGATDSITSPPDGGSATALYPYRRYQIEPPEEYQANYVDALGDERIVAFVIRRPLGLTEPTPLIVLSHGGSSGQNNPDHALDEWATVFARAGYVTAALAHRGRSADNYRALCDHIGVPPDEGLFRCAIKVNWDRPRDVSALLDHMQAHATDFPFIDLDRVGHGGHSAGGGAAMMTAGIPRNFVCAWPYGEPGSPEPCDTSELVSMREPRIDVAFAMSPQGPGSDGFMEASYASLAVPMFMATGPNDGEPGEGANRMALFPLLPESVPRAMLSIDEAGAKHSLFGGELSGCLRESSQRQCAQIREWVFSSAVAFADAHLRDSDSARAWLDAGIIEELTRRRAALDVR